MELLRYIREEISRIKEYNVKRLCKENIAIHVDSYEDFVDCISKIAINEEVFLVPGLKDNPYHLYKYEKNNTGCISIGEYTYKDMEYKYKIWYSNKEYWINKGYTIVEYKDIDII
jgi:hypothetical protein